jgi:hypothetical protein
MLGLENEVDELEEKSKTVTDESGPKLASHLSVQTQRLESLQQEIKAMQYTNSRLTGEIANKDEWIKVLMEHLAMKNKEIGRLKHRCVDLKVDFDHQLEKLAKRIELIVEKRTAEGDPALRNEYLSPVRGGFGLGAVESPIFEVLRKSAILGQSIDRSRQWPGNMLFGMKDAQGQSSSRLPLSSRVAVGESIDLTAALRESTSSRIQRAGELRRSINKINTIRLIRGGNSIQRFEDDHSQARDEIPERFREATINVFDAS